jgi:hypothetical protein
MSQDPNGGTTASPELSLGPLVTVSIILTIIGIVGFLLALSAGESSRAWQAFLVNLLFWMSVAQGGVVVSAAFYLTQGRWGGSATYRLAEAFSGFIPLGFLLFWGLYFGRAVIFPWVKHPIPQKEAWLNTPFLFTRDGIALAVMMLLSFWFVHASRRSDVKSWAQNPGTIALPPNIMRRLSPAVAISFAVVYTLIAFDLIMSLSPIWYSTLFGAYFFETAFWAAIVAMAVTAVLLRSRLGGRNRFQQPSVLHDLGKMVYAFSVFWVYLLFAQYLVIWYADIPVETFFVVVRVNYLPWAIVSWSVLTLVWALPFVVLLGRQPKRTPAILGTIALLGLIGVWLEIYVLVVPSLSPRRIPFGWVEALVTAGFLGLFALCAFPGIRLAAAAAVAEPGGELA